MDTPRRWQLTSLATAVVSLGFGGAMLARPSVDEVPSIDLDQVEATAGPSIQRGLVDDDADPVSPRIVLPASPTSPETVASPGSTASPDDAASPATAVPTDPAPLARPDRQPAPSPTSADSPPSAVSISADSDDSIDSSD